jgi:hypothetical protein
MNRRVAAGVGAAAVALGLAGWAALDGLPQRAPPPPADRPAPAEAAPDDTGPPGVEAVDTVSAPAPDNGGTPMAQRVATVGLLNKRNGTSRDITMRPGGAVRVGDAIVRVRACERTAPWEAEPLTGAFVQLDLRRADRHWHRVFSGWVYKERPALNVVQDAVYDVWAKSCTMSLPDTGPDTTPAGAVAPAAARPSARKSPDAAEPAPAAPGSDTPASADDNSPK